MRKAKVITSIVVIGIIASGAIYLLQRGSHKTDESGPVTLFGNVELRQVSLAFNNSERISEVLVDAGDHIAKGQVLARLETGRIAPLLSQAEAQTDAQRQILARLKSGSRPEEIAVAKANLESAKVSAEDASKRFDRLSSLRSTSGVSQQDLDTSEAAFKEASARAEASLKNYELVLAGPRKEDIAEASARLVALEATVALLKNQMSDTVLTAPTDAVVRTRVMEPGEMASPQKTVFTLAVTSPKWVRTYVSESQLGRVKPGMKAKIANDSFPDRAVEGSVGFIASVAEFTPKALQTEELRTSLVYEVRILVDDPNDDLRLGMPVTVLFD